MYQDLLLYRVYLDMWLSESQASSLTSLINEQTAAATLSANSEVREENRECLCLGGERDIYLVGQQLSAY